MGLMLTRRTVLAAPLALGFAAHSRATSAPAHFTVGDFAVTVLSDGGLSLPLSFAVRGRPWSEVEALFRSEGAPLDAVASAINVAVLRRGGDVVVVDAGAGTTFQDGAGRLADALEAAGLDPATVTAVVLTHGHADHLWGTIDDFDGSLRFPNARHVMSAAEIAFWTDPRTIGSVPDWLQGMAAGAVRVLKALEPKLVPARDGDTAAPGITMMATPGHTPGHMSVLVESAGARLLIGGDVITHPIISFARPDWAWGTDQDAEAAMRTRQRLLTFLASERIPLLGYHLPWPGRVRVERHGTAYRAVPSP